MAQRRALGCVGRCLAVPFPLGSQTVRISPLILRDLTAQPAGLLRNPGLEDPFKPNPFHSPHKRAGRNFGTVAECIAGLHEVTGLPWWATISLTTVGLRLSLFPFTVLQTKAMTGLSILSKNISQHRAEHKDTSVKTLQPMIREWNNWRKEKALAHPIWALSPIFVQLPAFITMMMTVRYMCHSSDYSLNTGGALWFSDLTLPAFELDNLTAPMGPAGAVLPGALCVLYLYNLQQSFSRTKDMPFLSFVQLFLEWLSIPILVVGLQLPHGVFCYWLTSNAFNAVQLKLLALPHVRASLGMVPEMQSSALDQQQQTLPATASGKKDGTKTGVEHSPEGLYKRAKSSDGSDTIALDEKYISSLTYDHTLALGKHLLKQEDWEQAYALFLVAATKLPDLQSPMYPQTIFLAAVSLTRMEKGAEAIALFEKVIEKDPKHTAAMLSIASIHKKAGNSEQARHWVQKASDIDPKVKERFPDDLDEKT